MEKPRLVEMYLRQRLSIADVAAQLKVSQTTVLKYLRIHGIQRRRLGDTPHPMYGQKYTKKRLRSYVGERTNIDWMRELRSAGLTFQEIADQLNTIGAHTKTGKSPWCRKGVWRTLKNPP